jgi:hypothetical protein
MKKTIIAIAALLMTAAAYAQGTVNFANRISGVFDQPILLTTDTTQGAGTIAGTTAQLLLVNGTSVTPVGTAITFRGTSGALAKYFDGGSVEIPGTSAGGTATLRVRISGTGVQTKDSASFTQALGGGTLPAENMTTFVGFNVTPAVPEPTTIALGVLGAAALIAARRRK